MGWAGQASAAPGLAHWRWRPGPALRAPAACLGCREQATPWPPQPRADALPLPTNAVTLQGREQATATPWPRGCRAAASWRPASACAALWLCKAASRPRPRPGREGAELSRRAADAGTGAWPPGSSGGEASASRCGRASASAWAVKLPPGELPRMECGWTFLSALVFSLKWASILGQN